jgi:RNA polymerase sigma-70 factor (ECF subfamily)
VAPSHPLFVDLTLFFCYIKNKSPRFVRNGIRFPSIKVKGLSNESKEAMTVEDTKIIQLYWDRDQSAIKESDQKYGRYCFTVANRILESREDSGECVNDTWHNAWRAIPPERPAKLQSFFARITRNLALDRYAYNNAQKRNARLETAMDEYWECIPNGEILPEDRIVLKDLINRFLADLDKQTRIIFLQRYWYVCTAREIARNVGLSESNVNVILHRTRNRFKLYLQKEGISV